jgi:RNA polymerase sigma factor (sigma-70 family)
MAATDIRDSDRVLAAREGDRAAFSSLISEHEALVIRLCRRIVSDEHLAEDAFQEACVTAWLDLGRLRNPDRFGPWLAGIAINICKGWLRKPRANEWSLEALSGGMFFDRSDPIEPGPEDRSLQVHVAAAVHEAIRELPKSQQRPLLLHYIDGLTHSEVAALLGTSSGAIRVRLHDARNKLKQKLLDLWEEEMPSKEKEIPMRLLGVSEARPLGPALHVAYVAVLGDEEGERHLPIFMGAAEGTALALQLEGVQPPRPMTYAFAASLVSALGGTLEEVRITRLHESTFYAIAVVNGPNGRKEVDARPSDALNLALTLDAPIRVDPSVLEELVKDERHKDFINQSVEGAISGVEGAERIVGRIQAEWKAQTETE